MSEGGGASGSPKKGLTLDDLIAAIDRHKRNPSNIPKRILQYILHSYHQEVKKVIDAAQGSWERFKEGMQRKYRLGDGLLTTADLEAMNKEDFTKIGAFVQEFKKRARKVHGISEEAQCAIFLGLLTASETVELTRHGGGSTKLTWATIDRGVEVGCLDEVEQCHVRLQRQKRKERDATASGTPGVTRIVTDVLAQLGYATEPVVQRRVVTAVQVKGTEPVIEEAVQEELWEEEESVLQRLTKAQRKVRDLAQGGQRSGKVQAPQAVVAAPPSVAAPSFSAGPSSQGSVARGGNQGQGNQGNGGRGGGRGRGRSGGGRGGQWNIQGRGNQGRGYRGQGNQGQGYPGQGYQGQGYQGSQGYERPRFDWRSPICEHCDQQGHTIKFCNMRREDKKSRLISSTMDGNIYDQLGEFIDRRLGGVKAEAQRKAAAGPLPPATFRLWQEKKGPLVGIREFRLWQEKEEPPIGVEEVGSDEEVTQGKLWQEKKEPPIGVEEVGSDEEVTQGPRGGSKREEPIIIESDDEDEERGMKPPSVLLGKMEDLLDKVGRSDFTKTAMPRGGKGTRPPQRPLGASGGYEQHGPRHRESTPMYDDGDIELFLDSFWDHARRMGWTVAQAIGRPRGAGRFEEPVVRIRREATTRSEVEWRMQELRPSPVGPDGRPIRLEIGNASDFIPAFEWFMQGQGQPPIALARAPEIPEMWRDFWEQRGEELPSPVRVGLGVARKAEERLDRKIKFLAKTTFDRHLLLKSDLAGKKIKEADHGVRLEAMEVEIQELKALVVNQTAIIESLRQRSQGGADKPESSRQGEQRQPGHGLPGQPSAAETRQKPPMGRVILEPEEVRDQREAERETFEFRAPT
ncbi:hypothetical protein CBR_g20350 [Chara braunii]|uniref:Uncharacterized protein n=1 Tax=Chara braunii TaxID=69332 RepID=A0A388JU48_CHABU|nr:hypothetical protein CBR_g20350 [Chara braunii]|eukprot:GBG61315.1 hypothetical protein CBR_g20350 [Chara braunii]